MNPIYLDHNATTPLDDRVLEEMLPFMREEFGNPSSMSHAYGWRANHAVKAARQKMADCLNCSPAEIYWTSGATESNNLAIWGNFVKWKDRKPHFITSDIEHKAVLDVVQNLEKNWDAEVTVLPADEFGLVDPAHVKKSIRPNTKLVSVMAANNEVGTIQDIQAIGEVCDSAGVVFHCDGAQAFGKVPIDMEALKIDLLSISGHKIYGPKGIGCLYVRGTKQEAMPSPMFYGGHQESCLRPGTLNVPGIIGLGAAGKIAIDEIDIENSRLWELQRLLRDGLVAPGSRVKLNGHPEKRLSNNISLSITDLEADVFALGLSGLALSSGSACTSASGEVSHVLKGLGLPNELARATIRIGMGRKTTKADILLAKEKISKMLDGAP